MLLIRIAAILAVIAVGVGMVLFLVTGRRKFLNFAFQTLKWGIVFALAVFALLALERLVVAV